MQFPDYRPRRLRKNDLFRRMVRETTLATDDLIYPLFCRIRQECQKNLYYPCRGSFSCPRIKSLKRPGRRRRWESRQCFCSASLIRRTRRLRVRLSRTALCSRLFGEIKKHVPGLLVITDVCLCEYTSHGHCGMIESGDVDNDDTLPVLVKTAVSHAEAGADMVAPSAMMDGQIEAIREGLDDAGFTNVPIMALQRQVCVPHFTARSGTLRSRPPSSATGGPTRWTRITAMKRFAR